MRSLYPTFLVVMFLGFNMAWVANAKCPSTIEEAGEIAPKMLLEKAVAEKVKGITDFSAEIGKSASSGVVGISGYDNLYLVQAVGKSQQLNGVLKCDKAKDQLLVLSLSWVSKNGNGVMSTPSKPNQ